MIRVEGNTDLVKNVTTGAILFNNPVAYHEYLNVVESEHKKAARIDAIENSIVEMKENINKLVLLIEKKYQ